MENAGTVSQECANIAEISLNEALNGIEAEDWKRAIQSEFESLIRNDTWVLTDRPKQRSVVGCRLVLGNKFNAEGILERRKARLVAKGYSQRPGLDFNETFSCGQAQLHKTLNGSCHRIRYGCSSPGRNHRTFERRVGRKGILWRYPSFLRNCCLVLSRRKS